MKARSVLVLADGKAAATVARAAVLKCGARIVEAAPADVVLVVGLPRSWKQYSRLVARAVNGRAATRKGSPRRRARTS